jgi:hypothetical protein
MVCFPEDDQICPRLSGRISRISPRESGHQKLWRLTWNFKNLGARSEPAWAIEARPGEVQYKDSRNWRLLIISLRSGGCVTRGQIKVSEHEELDTPFGFFE